MAQVMDFFSTNPLMVKQPKRFMVDVSEYYCFNQYGYQVAHVHEVGADGAMQALRFFARSTSGFERKVIINDSYRRPRLIIQKHWSFMTASTSVNLPDGSPVGTIEQDMKFFESAFTLLDPWKRQIGAIEGDLFAHDFRINDHNRHEIARVDRQVPDWGEVFTSADTYVLRQRYPSLPEPLRTLVMASGIAIDLVLHEGS